MRNSQLISRNLRQINHLYKKMLAKELLEHDLDQHFEVLWTLADQQQLLTQNKLAELLQIDKSRVANIIFDLEKRELIYIQRNPADRREHYVHLSQSARDAITYIEQSIGKINNLAQQGIDKEKLDTFFEVSELIQQNLKRSQNKGL